MTKYFFIFIISFIASFSITPFIRKFALKMKAVDRKGTRKVHTKTVTRLGGVAIFISFVIGCVLSTPFFNNALSINYLFNLSGILLGGMIVLSIGLLDDLKGIGAPIKFSFQIVAAVILLFFGFGLEKFTVPFKGEVLVGMLGIPLSILWIVGITNTINIIDGLDGLAAGIVGIVSIVLFGAVMKHGGGYPEMAFVSMALAGATLGFLKYNFHPAKIFMGDSGSLFLGFTLASLALWGNRKSTVAIALLVSVIAMGVPILDTTLAIIRRLTRGRHVFKADREHIHHKLLDRVKDQRKAVIILYAITIILGVIAVYIY